MEDRNYLVLLLDRADHSTLTQSVKATTGFDAGAYALSFDQEGEAREDGYKVLAVFSANDLKKYAAELDAFEGVLVPRYTENDIEFEEGILMSE